MNQYPLADAMTDRYVLASATTAGLFVFVLLLHRSLTFAPCTVRRGRRPQRLHCFALLGIVFQDVLGSAGLPGFKPQRHFLCEDVV